MSNNTEIKRGRPPATLVNTDRVKEIRESLNMTQEEFANSIEVSTDIISKIEQNVTGVTFNVALKICNTYDISLDWLLNLSDIAKNNAMKTVIALRDVFNISSEEIKGKTELTLTINENLVDFILSLERAELLKNNAEMSDKIYNAWIDEIEQRYIAKEKSSGIKNAVKYHLVMYSKLN